jgi:tetratricopeptide (TPR) repeat protein
MDNDSTNPQPRRFAIAVSFPGQHRRFVLNVVNRLADHLGRDRVFYDEWYESELVGLDGDLKLRRYYREQSDVVVPFFSEHYAKDWCQIEWSAIRAMLKERRKDDAVIPVALDGTRIEGWETIDFAIRKGNRNGREISDLIYAAYRQLYPEEPSGTASRPPSDPHGHRVGTPIPLAARWTRDVSRILKYAPEKLIGRDHELNLLTAAWKGDLQALACYQVTTIRHRPKVLTFVALGGEGKTSLVAKWAAELAAQEWPGCEAAFAWSFYSQGTREQLAASSDLFLKEALTFFGDAAMASSAQGAFEKGRRLAQLVGQQRALLILDGLEPLQYAPTAPTPGELKDQGIAALLKGLATVSHGLCVVTTRYSLPDLKAFRQTTAPEVSLLGLSREAGVQLLKTLGVNGNERRTLLVKDGDENSEKVNEFEKLVEDVKGHALTLTLLGSYLNDAHGGDIRKRNLVKLEEADDEIEVIPDHPHHAFHVMDAYVEWFETGGKTEEENKKGLRALALLRLLGLFDRPATADCLNALWKGEAIAELTEPLPGLTDAQRNTALKRLNDAKLLTVNRDASGALVSLDAHPHLREYFARQLRTQHPDAWRAAHQRLYEHLCANTKEGDQPTLEDLQPLYQAVAHGCLAGLQQEACAEVYHRRILLKNEQYSFHKLGVFGSDLGAIACFFERPWSRLSSALDDRWQAWLLGQTAFCMRSLGRLTEALEPMRAGLKMSLKQEGWKTAAAIASNLSELELTLGEVATAMGDAEQSVNHADRSGDPFQRMSKRTTHADTLYQAGRRVEAETRFREAEQMQAERQPEFPLLYSIPGFRYCDLLLAAPERVAWQRTLDGGGLSPRFPSDLSPSKTLAHPKVHEPVERYDFGLPTSRQSVKRADESPHSKTLREIRERASQTIQIGVGNNWLLDIALDHLTLGRAALYESILERSSVFTPLQRPIESAALNDDEDRSRLKAALKTARRELDAAVDGLRRAGMQDTIPHGLLTRAWLRFLTDACTGPDSAQEDLQEAWEIAERGPMKLFMADIHLSRTRLFHGVKPYPWAIDSDSNSRGPKDDLAAARKLIEQCGYWRRKEELEDAEAAAKNW